MRDRWSRRSRERFGDTPGPAGGTPADSTPAEITPADRARMLHERAGEAYRQGDVEMVERLADLIPEGPESEPWRTYARVLAVEGRADDAGAAAIARAYLDRLPPGHPEWDTARSLYGEVAVQALVMGTMPLAGNLAAAEQALRKEGDAYLHPSGVMVRYEPEEDEPLLLVLHGDAPKAARLARRAVRAERGSPAGRADALCTLSLCLCAAGDITGAREALAEAERVLPGRPRIAATRARIESSPAATLRTEE